jgi:hypothetical protein
VGDLPPFRVIHAVHEDLRNPNVLYVGTEFGLFVTVDAGTRWHSLKNNMPNVPVNDFVIQPRENDLVLGTHGRGIWILDQINAIQEHTADIEKKGSHLYSINSATMTRMASTRAHTGDMYFRGNNPPYGAIVDLWAKDSVGAGAHVLILDPANQPVARLPIPAGKTSGIRRVTWNLRLPALREGRGDDDEGFGGGMPGRFVTPGTYTARLTLNGVTTEQQFVVREDPKVTITDAQRSAWYGAIDEVATLYRRSSAMADSTRREERRVTALPEAERKRLGTRVTELQDLALQASELMQRVATLYGNIARFSEPPTADQRAQMGYFPTVLAEVMRRWQALGVIQ